MFALFLYLTLYLQNYLGYSPFEAGLRYLPVTVASFFVAPVAGALLSRVPARVLLSFGLAAAGVGLLLMSGVHAGRASGPPCSAASWSRAPAAGLLNPVIADVAVSVVPKERSGMAAGINDTFRQVGVAVGIAVWGAIFLGRGADKVAELTAGTPRRVGITPASSSRRSPRATSTRRWRRCRRQPGGGLARGPRGIPGRLQRRAHRSARCSASPARPWSLWLVREREIEREPVEPEGAPELPVTDEVAVSSGY